MVFHRALPFIGVSAFLLVCLLLHLLVVGLPWSSPSADSAGPHATTQAEWVGAGSFARKSTQLAPLLRRQARASLLRGSAAQSSIADTVESDAGLAAAAPVTPSLGSPSSSDPAPLPLQPVPGAENLLFIVSSVTRPNGTDYVSLLLASIIAGHAASSPPLDSRLRVLLYDADPPERRRPASWFAALPPGVEVRRPPASALAELAAVNTDPRKDKHHDPSDRIQWRTKGAHDLLSVLELAQQEGEQGWPYAILLQEDVQLSSTFFPKLRKILAAAPPAAASPAAPWVAWALFHAEAFDHGRIYADGAPYDFEACDQALLYNTKEMGGIVDYVKRNWRYDPSDWQLRDYQRASGALVRVAVPSLVQHIGQVSSLAAKQKDGGGIMSGCWAHDFVE